MIIKQIAQTDTKTLNLTRDNIKKFLNKDETIETLLEKMKISKSPRMIAKMYALLNKMVERGEAKYNTVTGTYDK